MPGIGKLTAIFWNKFKIPADFSTRKWNQGKISVFEESLSKWCVVCT